MAGEVAELASLMDLGLVIVLADGVYEYSTLTLVRTIIKDTNETSPRFKCYAIITCSHQSCPVIKVNIQNAIPQ